MNRFLVISGLLLVGCSGGGDYVDLVPPAALELQEHFGDIAIADFDGDGLNDIAVGSQTMEDRQLVDERISVYIQRPDTPGSFLAPGRFDSNPGGSLVDVLVADDCQRDGLFDLFATNWKEGGFRVLMNDPRQPGTFMPSVHYDAGQADFTSGRRHAVGDIDADGFPDVVVVTEQSVQWVPQDAQALGTFQPHRVVGEGRDDVHLGDVDGDGLLDIVVLGIDDDVSRSILVYYNNSSAPGQFLPARRLVTEDFAQYIGIADFDADGRTDIAVALDQFDSDDYLGNAAVTIFRQTEPGRFTSTAVTRTGGPAIMTVFDTADLDHNGFPELVFLSGNDVMGAALHIMESSSSAALSTRLKLTLPDEAENYSKGTSRLSIGDLNNDHLDDIAVIHKGIFVFFRKPGDPLAFQDPVRINTPL